MEIDVGEEDPFLSFIDLASSALSPAQENKEETESVKPGWSWIASQILKTCISYSSGVTPAILLSELSLAWTDQNSSGLSKKRPQFFNHLKHKHTRPKLQNTVTIDSIYDKNFLSLNSVLEAVIVDAFVLPGTNIYMITLGDFWSSNTIELYLHRRYYDLVDPCSGILKKEREVLLTGCTLRTAREGSGSNRLLPTEYLVILLDDDLDDDAMLIAAQFCSDSFSSISLSEVNNGASYSLYARIESVGSTVIHGGVERKHITLVDNDGVRLNLVLWGEQVLLANLFSIGSMFALESPYISSSLDSAVETGNELCLEYGSATQLYLVPFIQQEEHVYVPLTQNRNQGSSLMSEADPTQSLKVSQVSLPRNSQGSIDFSGYPCRSFVADLCDKMTGISLYGVIADIYRETKRKEVIFSLKIEDSTGAVWAKLHFSRSWSLGKLSIGHMVLIFGLSCYKRQNNRLEVSWYQNEGAVSFVNLSCLSALLNSSCLHKLSCLAELSISATQTHICRVRLAQVDQCHVDTVLTHSLCGHVVRDSVNGVSVCSFCQCDCGDDIVRTFNVKITLADDTAKVFVWCTGQTAVELLQISPDEFYELPEEEQFMYPSSLENESFIVALVNSRRQGYEKNESLSLESNGVPWEIARAQRCD